MRGILQRESAILGRVANAAEDLRRIECFDEEQLAEVHAILEAIRHDSESHAAAIKAMMARLGGRYDA